MKLDINTNGAWRTVLRGLVPGEDLSAARDAAATLARIDGATSRKPLSCRLVSEADEQVIERCTSSDGWVSAWTRGEAGGD